MTDLRGATLEKLRGIKNLPAIPHVMLEVSTYLKSEDHGSHKLAKIVSKDQSITTKLLSIANSPLFGLHRKVSSIELAIMLLGEEELANIVIALSMSEAIKFKDHELFNFEEYWRHSMLVASAANGISKKLKLNNIASEAFLGGILHDLGTLLIIQYFPKEFEKIVNIVQKNGVDFLTAEMEVLGCTHSELGKFMVEKWSLPEKICNVLEYHHVPSKAETDHKLIFIVHLADIMTLEFETGNIFWDEQAIFNESISDVLGFSSEADLMKFIEDYREPFIKTADALTI